jgi:hypothetical protein
MDDAASSLWRHSCTVCALSTDLYCMPLNSDLYCMHFKYRSLRKDAVKKIPHIGGCRISPFSIASLAPVTDQSFPACTAHELMCHIDTRTSQASTVVDYDTPFNVISDRSQACFDTDSVRARTRRSAHSSVGLSRLAWGGNLLSRRVSVSDLLNSLV